MVTLEKSGRARLLGGGALIFVTVGSMLSFDRMIRAVDAWALASGYTDIFAQIGDGRYEPRYLRFARILTPSEFTTKICAASLVIAHAGMGSVICAMEAGKPIVILPRHPEDREVTTDHQVHTAGWLKHRAGVFVAETEMELPRAIAEALGTSDGGVTRLPDAAPAEFVAKIRRFLTD